MGRLVILLDHDVVICKEQGQAMCQAQSALMRGTVVWHETSCLMQVMQCCKDFALRSAGVSAAVEYITWYRNSKQVYILSPSTLDMPSLRHLFLLPSKDEAVSSMVHSVAANAAHNAQRQALENAGITLPGSSRLTKTGAAEEEVCISVFIT